MGIQCIQLRARILYRRCVIVVHARSKTHCLHVMIQLQLAASKLEPLDQGILFVAAHGNGFHLGRAHGAVLLIITHPRKRRGQQCAARKHRAQRQGAGKAFQVLFHSTPPFNRTVTVVPRPSALSNDSVPWWICTISAHSRSPSPTPPLARARALSTR